MFEVSHGILPGCTSEMVNEAVDFVTCGKHSL